MRHLCVAPSCNQSSLISCSVNLLTKLDTELSLCNPAISLFYKAQNTVICYPEGQE